MIHQYRPLMNLIRGFVHYNVKLRALPCCNSANIFGFNLVTCRDFHSQKLNNLDAESPGLPVNETGLRVHNLLRKFSNRSHKERAKALYNCEVSLTDDLVLDVLRRTSSDYNSAIPFFKWIISVTDISGYTPTVEVYNEMLGILGKARRLEELKQMFNEMFERGLMNERSYEIVVHKFCAAHKIDDAIEFFDKRKEYGLKVDLAAFNSLLLSLCRYKHVETAELLLLKHYGTFTLALPTRLHSFGFRLAQLSERLRVAGIFHVKLTE